MVGHETLWSRRGGFFVLVVGKAVMRLDPSTLQATPLLDALLVTDSRRVLG